jgi:hypothetical protein
MRTPPKVEHAVNALSTIHHDGTYVVPAAIDYIDDLSLSRSNTILLMEAQRKHELLHFGYVAQLESFRVVFSKRPASPMQLFFFPRFTCGDCGHLWMSVKEYINLLCGATQNDAWDFRPLQPSFFV